MKNTRLIELQQEIDNITQEINALDQETVKKYVSLKKRLDKFKDEHEKEKKEYNDKLEKECQYTDGGHVWFFMSRSDVYEHNSYVEFTCSCLSCGKYETAKARSFYDPIFIGNVNNDDDNFHRYYERVAFARKIYNNLINEKKMSKSEARNFLKKEQENLNIEFKIHFTDYMNSIPAKTK